MYKKVSAIVSLIVMVALTAGHAQHLSSLHGNMPRQLSRMKPQPQQKAFIPKVTTSPDSLSVEGEPKPVVPVERTRPLKLEHAEPLYIDLIRDLGAHKGEKEWNVGMGMTDQLRHDSYEFLVEYEWAIIDRLGLEIEVPATIYTGRSMNSGDYSKPSNRVESLKLAAQYTFLVNEKWQTSLAIGGITEFEFTDLNKLNMRKPFHGVLYNPFFVAAKRWGHDFHTLLYTGPRFLNHFGPEKTEFAYEINTSAHYMIPGTSNFIGMEVNKLLQHGKLETVLRPQMRVALNEQLTLGIVPGIPVSKEHERLSAFMRLIYEPHF